MVEISVTNNQVSPGEASAYYAEACDHVVALMASGLSLSAAASAMGVSQATIRRWMDQHAKFRDAVQRGKGARLLALERQMLASENSAVISARRFALLNAASEEWREKQVGDLDKSEDESPIRQLARQLTGTAIRPKMREPKVIEHEPVAPCTVEPQPSVPVENQDNDEDDDEVRMHTVSPESYYDEGGEDAE